MARSAILHPTHLYVASVDQILYYFVLIHNATLCNLENTDLGLEHGWQYDTMIRHVLRRGGQQSGGGLTVLLQL